jgi:hypothetical protein
VPYIIIIIITSARLSTLWPAAVHDSCIDVVLISAPEHPLLVTRGVGIIINAITTLGAGSCLAIGALTAEQQSHAFKQASATCTAEFLLAEKRYLAIAVR